MRVALILLFLLSLGAIPGSLIPQTGVDERQGRRVPGRRTTTLAPRLREARSSSTSTARCGSRRSTSCCSSRSSAASCPRTWQFVGQLRGRPPARPAPADPAARVHHLAHRRRARARSARPRRELLKQRRFRAHRDGDAVAAEKGYLREVGNLVFHIALIVLLVAFAGGPAVQVRGRQADRRGRRLLQHPHPVRRLQVRLASSTRTTSTPFSFTPRRASTATYETQRPAEGHRRAPSRPTSRTARAPTARRRRPSIKVNEPAGDRRLQGLPASRTATRPSSPSGTARARSPTSGAVAVPAAATPTSPRTGVVKVHGRLPRREGQEGPARLPGLLRADLRRRRLGHDVLAVPGAGLPGAGPHRLPRRPGRRLRAAAERVPARHQAA